jgi:hypothetical protein
VIGNKRPGLVLQIRDRHLLNELATMKVIDREQTKLVAGFGSTTRVNRRLLALTHAGMLRRIFVGTMAGGRKAIYSLSLKGAHAVGLPNATNQRRQAQFLVHDLFLEHQFRINSVLILLKYRPRPVMGAHLQSWMGFQRPLSQGISVIPDAYFELNTDKGIHPMFLEVDLGTEALRIWKKKIEAYLRLAISGEFVNLFQRPQFRVLVLTTSERRLNQIRSLIRKSTMKIFWLSRFELMASKGFWSPIWLRPQGDDKLSLF